MRTLHPHRSPSLLRRAILAIAAAWLLALPASASTIHATASPFTGDPVTVDIEIDEASDPGNLVITLEVASDGKIGDLRGFFAEVSDEELLSGLSVEGDNVTGSRFASNSVIDLGQGANLQGGGSPCPCDLGVEIGAPGLGQGDDFQRVTFVLSHESEDLRADLFSDQLFGVRITSVGDEDGSRGGSSKLIGVVPEPGTALLLALGLAGFAGRRATQRRAS